MFRGLVTRLFARGFRLGFLDDCRLFLHRLWLGNVVDRVFLVLLREEGFDQFRKEPLHLGRGHLLAVEEGSVFLEQIFGQFGDRRRPIYVVERDLVDEGGLWILLEVVLDP